MANVGFMRKEILGELTGLAVQPDRQIVVHAGRPGVRPVVELCVIRTRPLGWSRPFRDLLRLRIEDRQAVALKHPAPQAVLRVDVPSPTAGTFRREVVPDGFERPSVGHPQLVVAHLHAVYVVLRIYTHIIAWRGGAAGRVRDGGPRVPRQVNTPRPARLSGRE